MKTVFKKNQLIITALAVMIAIAGYLKYADSGINPEEIAASTSSVEDTNLSAYKSQEELTTEDISTSDISAEDIYAETGETEDIASLETEDTDISADSAQVEAGTEEEVGDAVLTSGIISSNYATEAKINREQIRAKNKESLLEIVNSKEVSEAQKQEAIEAMLNITDIAEMEMEAETLLAAKGFEDVVVSITDNCADVVVNQTQVDDAKRAQIEDVITRKTGIIAENIVITPILTEE